MGFFGHGVTVFEKEFADVSLHGKPAFSFDVIPGQIDTGELGAVPIGGDVVVFSEDVGKMVGMFFANVLYTKIIHD